MQWIEQQVFYTHSKTILQSIRQKQPIFLLNAQTQELHGVFQRAPDAQLLQQDLTSPPGPHGYQVRHVLSVAASMHLSAQCLTPTLTLKNRIQKYPACQCTNCCQSECGD